MIAVVVNGDDDCCVLVMLVLNKEKLITYKTQLTKDIVMNKLLTVLLASLFATGAFAASHAGGAPMPEAMKQTNPKGEVAAQAKVDAKGTATDKSAKQPEAMAQGSTKAQAAAEAKKAKKAKTAKKKSTDEQMNKDAKKL